VQRTLGFRLHDVQLRGALAAADGTIIEMQTGEGKTVICGLTALLRMGFLAPGAWPSASQFAMVEFSDPAGGQPAPIILEIHHRRGIGNFSRMGGAFCVNWDEEGPSG
jgi:hypothetical protein